MLDQKMLLENLEAVRARLETRGQIISLNEFQRLVLRKKEIQKKVEELRAEKNRTSEVVAQMKREGKDAAQLIIEMRKVSEEEKLQEQKLRELEQEIRRQILNMPNLPDESVPVGYGPEDNVEVRRSGQPPQFDFQPEAHWDIGEKLDILDFERAARLAGSRFAVYFGAGALLERALINFMMDIQTKERGYTEVLPPFVANEESLVGTGNLPKFREDLFKLEGYDWYLIPTAEVPLTNLHRNEILDGTKLPLRYVAWTPCFRSEAGSYGKDIRGLVRLHQFNKIELMTFALPEKSSDELEYMTSSAEEVLKKLGLHYRIVLLCSADMGFASAKTYDLEVWMPSRKAFMEISSCSNCKDFQARRAGIRFRRGPKARPEYSHTLNGSGLAVGRTVSAILENYQQKDGSVVMPETLRPYLGGLKKIG